MIDRREEAIDNRRDMPTSRMDSKRLVKILSRQRPTRFANAWTNCATQGIDAFRLSSTLIHQFSTLPWNLLILLCRRPSSSSYIMDASPIMASPSPVTTARREQSIQDPDVDFP